MEHEMKMRKTSIFPNNKIMHRKRKNNPKTLIYIRLGKKKDFNKQIILNNVHKLIV